MNVAGIPEALRAEERWLTWAYVLREGRWTKVPRGRTNNPATWTTFPRALRESKRADGVGFVLGDGWAGADLDHCRDANTGAVGPRAQLLLEALASTYIEVSPSGTGFKAFFRAQRLGFQIDYSKAPAVTTAWTGARFFTVTGCGTGDPTADGEKQVDYWAPESKMPTIPPGGGFAAASDLSDDQLLLQIAGSPQGSRFLALWRGEKPGYASHSEADLALCGILAYWTNYDAARVDRLFRLSDLMRPKWNCSSYRQATLGRALMRRVA